MRNKLIAVIAAFAGTLLAAGAHLSSVQAQNEGKGVLARPSDSSSEISDPTEVDIIKALKPLPRTRGLGPLGGSGPTRSLSVAPGEERAALERGDDLPKVDLRIEFEPNSDRLTAASKQVLALLGEALKRPELGSNRFAIVGHTDGRGSDLYNQQLSERRAAAVKDYLVRSGGIEESRLFGHRNWLVGGGQPSRLGVMRTKVVVVIAAFAGALLPGGVHFSQAQAQNEGMGVLARPVPLGSGGGISDPARPSKEDIINALAPGGMMRTGIGSTRGISVEPGKEREAVAMGNFPKLDLRIEFEPNSERLTAASQQVLATLGAALKDPLLERSRIVIAGHTDGRGSEQSNQRLSQRRAATVKDYLVRKEGIKDARLIAIGFGKSKPLDPADPLSAENRRIEIVNLRD